MANAKVIVYINEKGGTGKTSICLNVGWELANRGNKVLLIDLDGQNSNLTYFIGKSEEAEQSLYDVLQNRVPIKEVILPVKENLDLIPATLPITDLSPTNAPVKKVKPIIRGLRNDYDYILIDVNPSPQWSHYLVLSVSDYAQIVMLPDAASLPAGDGMVDSIEDVQESSNKDLKTLGILFNMNDETTVIGREVRNVAEDYAKRLKSKVMITKIRRAVPMREYVSEHKGVTDYASKTAVADDIRRLVDETESAVNS